MKLNVNWNGVKSDSFRMHQGVRQGGVLSPELFSVYLDGLLEALRGSGMGFYMGKTFVGCVAYADDLVLLSSSLTGLQ